jgi:hypothetical protein
MGADSIEKEDDQHELRHEFKEVLLELKYHERYDAIKKPACPGPGGVQKKYVTKARRFDEWRW